MCDLCGEEFCCVPKGEIVYEYDFYEVLEYLEQHGNPGIKDRLVDVWSSHLVNGSPFYLYLYDDEEQDFYDRITFSDNRILATVLNKEPGTTVLMYVSW